MTWTPTTATSGWLVGSWSSDKCSEPSPGSTKHMNTVQTQLFSHPEFQAPSPHLSKTCPSPEAQPNPSDSMKLLSPQFKGASPTPSLQNSIIHPFKCVFTEHVPCDLVRQTWSRQTAASICSSKNQYHALWSISQSASCQIQWPVLHPPATSNGCPLPLPFSGRLLGTEFWLPSTPTAIRRLLHALLCLLSYWQGVSSTSRQPWALPLSAPGLSILLPTTLQQPPNAPLLLPVSSPFSPASWLCLM